MAELPNEILTIILRSCLPTLPAYFEDPGEYKLHKQTLANVCLASRNFRAIAQPLLYHSFIKDKPSDGRILEPQDSNLSHKEVDHEHEAYDAVQEAERSSNLGDENAVDGISEAKLDQAAEGFDVQDEFHGQYRPATPLELFLATLIARPDLAACVEWLRIETFFDDAVSHLCDAAVSPPNPRFAELFEQRVMEIPNPRVDQFSGFWSYWKLGLAEGLEGAHVALLLALVPNLRHLHLAPIGESLGTFVQPLIECFLEHPPGSVHNDSPRWSQATRLPLFRKLESFTVICTILLDDGLDDDDEEEEGEGEEIIDGVELDNCLAVMMLPTLKSFSAWGIKCESYDEDWSPRLSHLQHLHLENCRIEVDRYRALLDTCPNLTSLDLSFIHDFGVNFDNDFAESLKGMAKTLERLVMYAPKTWNEEITYSGTYDFSTFERLRYMEIDEAMLYETADRLHDFTEFLPRGLKWLAIRNSVGFVPINPFLLALATDFSDFKGLGVGVAHQAPRELRRMLHVLGGETNSPPSDLTIWSENAPPRYSGEWLKWLGEHSMIEGMASFIMDRYAGMETH